MSVSINISKKQSKLGSHDPDWALHAPELASTAGDPMNEGCPQCPVLTSPAQLPHPHADGFAHGFNPAHVWFSSFPAAFYSCQHYCLF